MKSPWCPTCWKTGSSKYESIRLLFLDYYLAYIKSLFNLTLGESGAAMSQALLDELQTHTRQNGWQLHFKMLQRVRDEFFATASYDLKNPIMAISGFSQLLPAAGPLNTQQQEFAQRISLAAGNMQELVENTHDLARIDAGIEFDPEIVDLSSLVVEIAREFESQAKAKDQVFIVNTLQNSMQVNGNPFQLKQALRNLVGNAIKYTPTDGTVSLDVDANQYTVSVHVIDTGYGILAKDLPHIFDRFVSGPPGCHE